MHALVSIITPTFGRERFLGYSWQWIRVQTHPHVEWLILDDSPDPSPVFAAHADERIRYEHVTQRLTIGEKRNRLIARARGEYIAQFDDDDYYAPRFLELLLSRLDAERADFVNLSSWYLYDVRHDLFGFWDLRQTTGLHFMCYANGLGLKTFTAENNHSLAGNHMGYGFTYLYRRTVWEASPFDAIDWGEDARFVMAAARRFKLLSLGDHSGLVLHVLHPSSTSSCMPQFRLPSFLLPALFAPCADYLEALRRWRDSALPRT